MRTWGGKFSVSSLSKYDAASHSDMSMPRGKCVLTQQLNSSDTDTISNMHSIPAWLTLLYEYLLFAVPNPSHTLWPECNTTSSRTFPLEATWGNLSKNLCSSYRHQPYIMGNYCNLTNPICWWSQLLRQMERLKCFCIATVVILPLLVMH